MRRWLTVAVMTVAAMVPGVAWAGESPPPKGGNDSGCCLQFTNSPVVLCMVKGACTFTAPPPK